MKLLRRINEGSMYPSMWWGFCWWDHARHRAVIAPIGLNVLIALARWCWIWTAWRATSYLDSRLPK